MDYPLPNLNKLSSLGYIVSLLVILELLYEKLAKHDCMTTKKKNLFCFLEKILFIAIKLSKKSMKTSPSKKLNIITSNCNYSLGISVHCL